jgi:hypothetical protein
VSSTIVFLEIDAGDKGEVSGTNSERLENPVLAVSSNRRIFRLA